MPVIESTENIIQLFTTGFCAGFSAYRAFKTGKHAWVLLFFAAFVYFLGDIYWQLYLTFYGETPHYSNISYAGWYACYLFLILLVHDIRGHRDKTPYSRFLLLIPVFTAGMCVFYLQYGDVIGNILAAVLMSILIWVTVDALMQCKKKELSKSDALHTNMNRIGLYITVLVFCFAEYAAWTTSCFWMGDTFANPYFYFDTVLSLTFLIFPHALRSALKGQGKVTDGYEDRNTPDGKVAQND